MFVISVLFRTRVMLGYGGFDMIGYMRPSQRGKREIQRLVEIHGLKVTESIASYTWQRFEHGVSIVSTSTMISPFFFTSITKIMLYACCSAR